MPVYRGRRGHGRADEVRTATIALAAFEVAVAGRGAALARFQAVGGSTPSAPTIHLNVKKANIGSPFLLPHTPKTQDSMHV